MAKEFENFAQKNEWFEWFENFSIRKTNHQSFDFYQGRIDPQDGQDDQKNEWFEWFENFSIRKPQKPEKTPGLSSWQKNLVEMTGKNQKNWLKFCKGRPFSNLNFSSERSRLQHAKGWLKTTTAAC